MAWFDIIDVHQHTMLGILFAVESGKMCLFCVSLGDINRYSNTARLTVLCDL